LGGPSRFACLCGWGPWPDAAVAAAFENLPGPLGLPRVTAAIMSLESYPVSAGLAGSVDTERLRRVVDVMQQFIGFDPSFNIDSMLMGG